AAADPHGNRKALQESPAIPAKTTGHFAGNETQDAPFAALEPGANYGGHLAADSRHSLQLDLAALAGGPVAASCGRAAATRKRDRAHPKEAGGVHSQRGSRRRGHAAQGAADTQPAHPASRRG